MAKGTKMAEKCKMTRRTLSAQSSEFLIEAVELLLQRKLLIVRVAERIVE